MKLLSSTFIFSQADIDNSGTIDYGEFVAATLHLNKIEEDHLSAAFSFFDKDGSGFIMQDEIQQVCEEFGVEDFHLEELLREVDQDNMLFGDSNIFEILGVIEFCPRRQDGRIEYNEFVEMM